jgi:hypothetical protein
MKIDGACQCGQIAYEAKVDPAKSSICNCTDCQKFSGSPWRASIPSLAADFRMLRGEVKIYIKIADSGTKRVQAFCGECGSAIYSTSVGGERQIYNIRLGGVTQRADLPPQKQIWCSSAIPWSRDISDIPGVPEG